MDRPLSSALFAQAQRSIPGGVNSPVRAFRGVGGTPVFFSEGDGPWLWDVDGNRYVDYVGSWGPMLQGHAFPPVVKAVRRQAARGLSFGAPTEVETELAEIVVERVPGIEQVRMVNSGTEAVLSAVRLARAVTGRDMLLKFQGCYHGHADSLLAQAGSGVLTLGLPDSPGVPADTAKHTLTVPYNDAAAVAAAFERYGEQIAAVIVEPIAGNMGCVPPALGFLEALRDLTNAAGSLLIFDEVMTGFRVHRGGAQALYGVTPDITTLGKAIGGGLPVGAFGGSAEIMARLAPLGDVYQAGTLSGNPLAMQAGLALLRSLNTNFYRVLTAATKALTEGIREEAAEHGVPVVVNTVRGMFSIFFTDEPVTCYADVAAADAARYGRFFHALLEGGVYLAPSAFEAGFVSGQHDEDAVGHTLGAMSDAFASLAEQEATK